jgi:hypothetical protein
MAERLHPAPVDVELAEGACIISKMTVRRIEDVPAVVKIDGRRFRTTSHDGPFDGPDGRPTYQVSVEAVDEF